MSTSPQSKPEANRTPAASEQRKQKKGLLARFLDWLDASKDDDYRIPRPPACGG